MPSLSRTWSAYGTTTQTAGTAITLLCPPSPGNLGNSAPFIYKLDSSGNPNWWYGGVGITKVSLLRYICGSTSHQLKFIRPKNFTTVASAAAKNQAVINIVADPGIYSTNYKYLNNQATAAVADNAISANDWCVYQLVDGTWIFDTVSSVSTLAITMSNNIPNITGGGVAAGAPFFFFGISTDKDPATGFAPMVRYTTASATDTYNDPRYGVAEGLHYGDPLLFQSDNANAAGFVSALQGFYSDN
jgi:hypothetical protein